MSGYDFRVRKYAKAREKRKDGFDSDAEKKYDELLKKRLYAGEIHDYRYSPFNLRLADKTYYKPDFLVVENDMTLTMVEVKGRWMDDARVKFKTAAEQFPWLRFVAAVYKNKTWTYEEMK